MNSEAGNGIPLIADSQDPASLGPPSIETSPVRLRARRLADLNAIAEMDADPVVRKDFDGPRLIGLWPPTIRIRHRSAGA